MLKYFKYLQDEQQDDNEICKKILSQLTLSLKTEVLTDIFGKILMQKKLFNLNFSQEFLLRLAPKLKEKQLGPDEIIYASNEVLDKIYFVIRGSVDLYIQNPDRIIS